MVAQIDARLDAAVHEHRVHIPLAIESGSRAWGFPSPDSDYDCRFIYVSGLDSYLSPWPARDVIETPLTTVLDVNGWDLMKALQLLVKGNAVLIEWLTSPICYRGDPEFRARLLALAYEVADRDAVARHYLHLGAGQWERYSTGPAMPLKKLFYSLRPALALRWLREHADAAVAPMHLPTLLTECDVSADLAGAVNELIAQKAVTRELGDGPVPAPIRAFIASEYGLATTTLAAAKPRNPEPARARTAAFFRAEALRAAGPHCG